MAISNFVKVEKDFGGTKISITVSTDASNEQELLSTVQNVNAIILEANKLVNSVQTVAVEATPVAKKSTPVAKKKAGRPAKKVEAVTEATAETPVESPVAGKEVAEPVVNAFAESTAKQLIEQDSKSYEAMSAEEFSDYIFKAVSTATKKKITTEDEAYATLTLQDLEVIKSFT